MYNVLISRNEIIASAEATRRKRDLAITSLTLFGRRPSFARPDENKNQSTVHSPRSTPANLQFHSEHFFIFFLFFIFCALSTVRDSLRATCKRVNVPSFHRSERGKFSDRTFPRIVDKFHADATVLVRQNKHGYIAKSATGREANWRKNSTFALFPWKRRARCAQLRKRKGAGWIRKHTVEEIGRANRSSSINIRGRAS